MTRDELAALLSDVAGLRLRPVELDTIMAAVDAYVMIERARVAQRWRELDAIPDEA